MDIPITKMCCVQSIFEVLVQRWTFTISLPIFYSMIYLFLILYLSYFYWKRGLHIFTYNLKYEPTKSKYKK